MNKLSNVVFYGLAVLFLKGISFFMMPIVTRFLSLEEYGLLNFLVSIASMLSIILSLGLSELLYRYHIYTSYNSEIVFYKNCFKTSLISLFICFFSALFLSEFIVEILPTKVPEIALKLLLINLGGSVMLSLPLSIMRIKGKAKQYMYIAVFQGVFQAVLTLLFLQYELGVVGIMLSGAISVWILLVFLGFMYREVFTNKKFMCNTYLEKKHALYIVSITLSSLFMYGLNGVENWILVLFKGKESLAIYFIATQFALVISIAFEPFRLWWYPQRFRVYSNKPLFAAEIPVYGLWFALIMVNTMIVIGPIIIEMILPKSFHNSKTILPWLCIIFFIKTTAELLNFGCYYKVDARSAPLINGICAILAILSCYFSLKYYDIHTMLIGMMVVHFIRLFMFYFISQRLVYLNYKIPNVLIMYLVLFLQGYIVVYESEYALISYIVFFSFSILYFFHNRRTISCIVEG